jgi:hypothetical protein
VPLYRFACRLMAVPALICMHGLAAARTTTTTAPSASPPCNSSLKVDMVLSLFVMNARGASLQGLTLTLPA